MSALRAVHRWLCVALAAALATRQIDAFSEIDVGLRDVKGQLAALGDLDSDKHTDLFVISPDRMSLHVLRARGGHFESVPGATLEEGAPIASVFPTDFDNDGQLDVLVSGRTRNDSNSTFLHVWRGQLTSFVGPATVLPEARDQVLAFSTEVGEQFKVHLFGARARDGRRAWWWNRGRLAGNESERVQFTQELVEPLPPGLSPTLASPHSHTFADLDGDCLADMIVSALAIEGGGSGEGDSENPAPPLYELWLNTGGGAFRLHSKHRGPPGAGQLTAIDVDSDGTLDLVLPVQNSSAPSGRQSALYILFNEQKPLCQSRFRSGSGCRAQSALCEGDPLFRFSNDWASPNGDSLKVVLPLELDFSPTTDEAPLVTARAGDVDLDGFPDLLLVMTDSGGQDGFATLWKNVPCSSERCGVPAASRRTFSRERDAGLEGVRGVYAATFFDLGDNGMLDVLLAARRPENASEHRIVALENEQSVDAFFLTTLGLNGVCQAWCPSGARFPSPKPYGVNQPGVTTKFTVTLMSGRKRLRQGAQLTQSAYLPLQAPYQFFGLGRTNNYIEEFSMGMPRTAGRHHQRWVAIIPNSQLIMFPYEPWKPENWSLELFVSPSSSLVLVVGVLAAVLTLLALLITFFHWKERKQDESESQSSRLLTF